MRTHRCVDSNSSMKGSRASRLWQSLVVLTLVAETVTLSRAIDAVAPLRWFDRLGRIRPIEAGIDDA